MIMIDQVLGSEFTFIWTSTFKFNDFKKSKNPFCLSVVGGTIELLNCIHITYYMSTFVYFCNLL